MTLVAGIDSSTQSTKIVVCDADDGTVVRQASAQHPSGTEVEPEAWWTALETAASGNLLDGVSAISVAGQQHGMVVLDDDGEVVRPALLWNDVRSASASRELISELGGESAWADAVGSVPIAAFTISKLRWLARHEPSSASRVASVVLPHDWLTWRLLGGPAAGAEALVTDRGDASGTGYFSPASNSWRYDLLELSLGRSARLPRIASPSEVVGEARCLAPGIAVGPGTGDNMAAALGLGMQPGDVVVSLGTSGTIYQVSSVPVADPSGQVAGFADATGHFLPLVCTLNATRVLSSIAALLGVDAAGLDALAQAAPAGAGGLTLLPFFDGERTPNLPDAQGLLAGITRENLSAPHLARAAVEGVLCSLAAGLEALENLGLVPTRGLLIGGGARSTAVEAIAPSLFGFSFELPDPSVEWVAQGAARQAAWALTGGAEPPSWPVRTRRLVGQDDAVVVAKYRQLLSAALPVLGS